MLGVKLKRVKLKDIEIPSYVEWSKEQIGMTQEIENNYDPRKGLISISLTNKIFDGRHRFLILLNKFGGEHKIIVRKIYFSGRIYFTIIWLLIPILLPISFIIKYKKNANIKRKNVL